MERLEKFDEEQERLIESSTTVLDFDMLCSSVALQNQGKWEEVETEDIEFDADGDGVGFGAVLRMWEGEVMDFFDDSRIAIQSACCPCYRFGKNMKRAGFGSCFGHGTVYFSLSIGALLNCIAFILTWRHCFLYLAVVFSISLGAFIGFYRAQTKKKFNIIMGSDGLLNDCIYQFVFPCCTLAQESRTLEMNNVYDGTWHGRGETMCIGSFSEERKDFFGLNTTLISIKSPDVCSMQKNADVGIPLEHVPNPWT